MRRTILGILAALVSGIFISGFIIPSTAQAPPVPKLQAYVLTLPKSVVKIRMMPVPGGSIKIGGQTVEVKPFWIARTEIPWEAYDVYTASGPPSPSYGLEEFGPDAIARPSKSFHLPDLGWGHTGYPAINISSLSAQMFCRWLSKETGKKYRLPTEAEWEFACRGGVAGVWKADRATMDKIAWHAGNSDRLTHPVGKKSPNKLGLHDMFGNPGEWAMDLEGKPILCGGTFLDGPKGMIPGMRRRFQPKWQETDPQFPKSRWWLADGKFVGFRIACEP